MRLILDIFSKLDHYFSQIIISRGSDQNRLKYEMFGYQLFKLKLFARETREKKLF